jgi:hypothetical protein
VVSLIVASSAAPFSDTTTHKTARAASSRYEILVRTADGDEAAHQVITATVGSDGQLKS